MARLRRRRPGPRPRVLSVYGSAAVTAVFVALLGWLVIETPGGSLLGQAARLTSSVQTSWPFAVAVTLRRARASAHPTSRPELYELILVKRALSVPGMARRISSSLRWVAR